MFERFGPASLRVLRVAEQECRNHNQYYVGAEHLMVALLEERDPEILHDLTADGIDVRELHADVRRHLGAGEDRLWEGILVTPRVRKIIVLAESYAGEAHVEPVHLLRALRSEGGSLAAEILRRSTSRNSATGG
ncbi:MAG: Clp protease N-terminal domain-containing protein [Candidatus Aquilonibacter sp.]